MAVSMKPIPLDAAVREFVEAVDAFESDPRFENAAKVCLTSKTAWSAFYLEFLASTPERVARYREPLGAALQRGARALRKFQRTTVLKPDEKYRLTLYLRNVSFRKMWIETLYAKGPGAVTQSIYELQLAV